MGVGMNEAEHRRLHELGIEHEHNHEHASEHEHADSYEHSHDYSHGHGPHGHVHANQKAVVNRLARAIGHLERVRMMVEEGYDCSEVLIQLSAVQSALNNAGKIILKDHIEHCIVDAAKEGDNKAIEELNKAIDRFIK